MNHNTYLAAWAHQRTEQIRSLVRDDERSCVTEYAQRILYDWARGGRRHTNGLSDRKRGQEQTARGRQENVEDGAGAMCRRASAMGNESGMRGD